MRQGGDPDPNIVRQRYTYLHPHFSPEMTQRYAHLRDETLRSASDLAGQIISEAVNGKDSGKKKVANFEKMEK